MALKQHCASAVKWIQSSWALITAMVPIASFQGYKLASETASQLCRKHEGLFGIFLSFRPMHSAVQSTGSPIHLEFAPERVDSKWLYQTHGSLRDFLMCWCRDVPCASQTAAVRVLDALPPYWGRLAKAELAYCVYGFYGYPFHNEANDFHVYPQSLRTVGGCISFQCGKEVLYNSTSSRWRIGGHW